MTFFIAFLVGKCVGPDITDAEAHKDLLSGFNGCLAATNQLFSFSADHVAVDIGILGIIHRAAQSRNGNCHEWLTFAARFHFTDTVEITDTSGVKVEEFCFVGLISAHGDSPVSK